MIHNRPRPTTNPPMFRMSSYSTSSDELWSTGDTDDGEGYWADSDHTTYVRSVSTGTNPIHGKSYLPETRCKYCGRLDRDNSETCNGCGAPL